jgi:F-type H+-transporting ATPase subunit epsilon
MKLQIVSATGNILEVDNFSRIILMTEMGEITLLPGHEPLISAIRPGIMSVEYVDDTGKVLHMDYASGGGVLNITPESCTIVADVIENGDHLTDLEYITTQKKEAEALVKAYKEENGVSIDSKHLLELEYELLKYTAMHRLGERYHIENLTGSRR